MENYTKEVVEKWSNLIDIAKSYWVDNKPTGCSDSEFDELERRAIQEDNFYVRDYVFSQLSGTKVLNHDISKITKFKVSPESTMMKAIQQTERELGSEVYWDFKYDGSSIAIYVDPSTGKPERLVSCGNLSINDYGHDRTANLISLIPLKFPLGIRTIQCEAVIDLTRFEGDPDRARQASNGLVNSKYCNDDIKKLLTLRAYRYWADPNTPDGQSIINKDYREVLGMLGVARSKEDNHITFSPADSWTSTELSEMPGFTEGDAGDTSTGRFLRDGFVAYTKGGQCLRALKFSGAGATTELIKTTVKSIQWNNQSSKGKDSWSANVIIEPTKVRGCTVTKPSAGSVSKLIKKNITPGAKVSIIMANSTIPMVGDVFTGGSGDYMWPTCSCGYKMSDKDVFGSLLKCGNPECSDRMERMRKYLKKLKNIGDINLNEFLVIDRFRWETTGIDISSLLDYVIYKNESGFHDYLLSFLKTDLQKRNLEVVWLASYKVLLESYEENN